MLKFVKAFGLAALLMLGVMSLFAQRAAAQEGKITGTIIDFDGKPWADLQIKLKSDQGVAQETKTDATGKFLFANLKSGRFTVTIHPPQLKDPYEIVTEVHSGTDGLPVNLNFKEILEKQHPEYAAQMKKQNEEKQKVAGMKEHFSKGVALLDQEKAARAEAAKAPADQRDAAKAKVSDLADQAVVEFQNAQKTAPEKDPNTHLFWARMGEAYDIAGRNDEAVNAYQQAVAAKPDPNYYNNLGNALARGGKLEDAKAAYTKSAELDPPNAGLAWRNFGISLYQVDRKVEAIEPLKKATELDPKSAQGWYLLATCMMSDPSVFKQVGDKIEVTPLPGTIEAYQKAIELDPNGTYGKQAKEGLEQLQQMTGGIETKLGGKKKKP